MWDADLPTSTYSSVYTVKRTSISLQLLVMRKLRPAPPPQLAAVEFFANANYGSDMASGTVLLLLLAFSSLSASKFSGPLCNC